MPGNGLKGWEIVNTGILPNKNQISKYTILSRHPSVSACTEMKNLILYHADTSQEKVINSTGKILWTLTNGQNSVEELAKGLAKTCNVKLDSEVQTDVMEFVNELLQQGFVTTAKNKTEICPPEQEYSSIVDAPRIFDISLTGKCNLACQYCFYADEMAGRDDLSTESWLKFFEELESLAVRKLVLSGGEVFMRKDLWDIIDGLIQRRMRYSILTNGTLISDVTISKLLETHRLKRLEGIQVSIDGSCAEIHDKSRGTGSFDKAVRGLKLLISAKLPVQVRVTLNRHNVDDIDNIAEFLLEELKLPGFGTNDAIPLGAGCANSGGITLLPQQRITAMKKLVMLDRRYPGRINASAGALAEWRMFNQMENARKTGKLSNSFQMGKLSACGCMFVKLAIHQDGTIAPCNMLQNISLGRINETSIKDTWKGNAFLNEMRKRRKIPMIDIPGCRDCEWASYCNGGCPSTEFRGDLRVVNPKNCYRKFIKDTGGLPQISDTE